MMILGDRSITGGDRVLRGGSWNNNGRNVRSAIRNHNQPDNRNNNIGFRLALAQCALDEAQMTRSSSRLAFTRKQKARSPVCW